MLNFSAPVTSSAQANNRWSGLRAGFFTAK